MKKILFILLFIFGGAFIAFSQSFLTVGQVYNFNVGDVFETECGTSPSQGPPIYYLTIVLAKWYSSHSDTVYYKDSVVDYSPPGCPPPCTGTFSTGIDTSFYTNLNSRAVQDTVPNECPALWDSVYIDSSAGCWQKIWEEGPSKDCLDTLPITFDGWNTTYSWLIEGCGGPYTNVFFEGNDYGDFCTLIYSKKHDTICGSEVVITGIPPINPVMPDFKILPNPSTGIFNIALSHPELVSGSQTIVEVYNVFGEKVYSSSYQPLANSQQLKTIDLSNQPNGIYLYRVLNADGSPLGNGKVIIQK